MRLVIERVKKAEVKVNNVIVAKIEKGIAVYIGFQKDDTEKSFDCIINRLINLRIFPDDNDKMNVSVKEIRAEILVIPNFTLYGELNQNRPSFIKAMEASRAKVLYEKFLEQLRERYYKVESGVFGAMMEVELINDGPVMLIISD
jgi:D-tyrosyl-tRNA(Tyr) deacylase